MGTTQTTIHSKRKRKLLFISYRRQQNCFSIELPEVADAAEHLRANRILRRGSLTTSERHGWPRTPTASGPALQQHAGGLFAVAQGDGRPRAVRTGASSLSAELADPFAVDLLCADTTQECWRRARSAVHTKRFYAFTRRRRPPRAPKKVKPRSGTRPGDSAEPSATIDTLRLDLSGWICSATHAPSSAACCAVLTRRTPPACEKSATAMIGKKKSGGLR